MSIYVTHMGGFKLGVLSKLKLYSECNIGWHFRGRGPGMTFYYGVGSSPQNFHFFSFDGFPIVQEYNKFYSVS